MHLLTQRKSGLREGLAALWPAALAIDARERVRVVVGVALGLAVTAWLSHALVPGGIWLVAPIGASAVLVFGLPSSPLAQPWAVVGGNTVSALVGIAVMHLAPPGAVAAPAVAAGLAVALMLATRCLHPPGGAAALLTVLSGVVDWRFAFFPVALNSLLLVTAGAVYNRATGRSYPHRPGEARPAGPAQRFADADIDRVLRRYNQVLDVPRDELHALLEAAESEAYRRRMGERSCADAMTRDVISVEFGTPLQAAWALLRASSVKALPVVDKWRHVVGIVTQADFLHGDAFDHHRGLAERLRRLVAPTPGMHSDKAEVVGQIMTRRVRVASADKSLASLVPLFSDTGHHHIPVVDADRKLVGILTQTDLVRALVREG